MTPPRSGFKLSAVKKIAAALLAVYYMVTWKELVPRRAAPNYQAVEHSISLDTEGCTIAQVEQQQIFESEDQALDFMKAYKDERTKWDMKLFEVTPAADRHAAEDDQDDAERK